MSGPTCPRQPRIDALRVALVSIRGDCGSIKPHAHLAELPLWAERALLVDDAARRGGPRACPLVLALGRELAQKQEQDPTRFWSPERQASFEAIAGLAEADTEPAGLELGEGPAPAGARELHHTAAGWLAVVVGEEITRAFHVGAVIDVQPNRYGARCVLFLLPYRDKCPLDMDLADVLRVLHQASEHSPRSCADPVIAM